ncbi:Bicarbonate transport system permease protein CmpB [uncultured Flavonifractor sp.]|nr:MULTISPECIES: ABC transporter permease [Eubacteriales]SCG98192.1 Bicarbonate transport system permease protein CmpB [uncultured Clostridium sp.]SCI12387.1 Bicarbonate transport system permease protein CmpB [uncultured Flavonifractor sp.]MCH1979162.1 ABC transporter permease [Lawsonibacter sp. OA9]MCU6701635.1 ABC transporter permease [Muriventricola aceti]SCI70677.1 Bicarbonate transport system permease protein CmpB [uncultured Flavonifractor sp.]
MSEPIHEMTAAERVALVEREKHRITYRNITLSFAGILLFLLIWEGLALSGIVDSRILCDVLEVLRLFVTKLSDPNPDGAVLTVHIWSSLQVALLGFLLAVVIGVPLGWLMGWYRGADSFLRPIFEIIRPIPPVSWIPLTIVWLGIGLPAKSFIVFFAAFVPCLINAYTGIRQTKEVLKNVGKTFGASYFTVFVKVGIPSSLVMTFAGIKVAIGNAWATLVAAEMLAASSGLGYMILMGRSYARVDLIILGIVVIGVLGVIISAIINRLERIFLGWRYV